MPNDQFGRPVAVGDTVVIKGEVTRVLEDPNFINCTVKLARQMPPAGTEINLQLNTAQLETQGGAEAGVKSTKENAAKSPPPHAEAPQHGETEKPPAPPTHTTKK